MIGVTAVCMMILCLQALPNASASTWATEEVSDDNQRNDEFFWAPTWRSPADCGQIAAFVVASLLDKEVSLLDVKTAMPAGPNGVSCAQIEDYLDTVDLTFDTIWVNPESFAELNFPAIIHGQRGADNGHFFVILAADEKLEKFTILNTTLVE